MRLSIVLPQLGQSVAEGAVVRWLKREGERVAKDESLVEISTDKVSSELPAPAAGVLARILVKENETVKVGTVLAELEAAASGEIPQSHIINHPSPAPSSSPSSSPPSSRFYSPAVRAKAKDLGLTEAALAAIAGTGAGGRVTVADVERFAGSCAPVPRPPSPAPRPPSLVPRPPSLGAQSVPLDPVCRAMAAVMTRSAQIPQVTTVAEADLTAVVAHRERTKSEFEKAHGCKLTWLAYVAEAAVKALVEFPHLNASFEGETVLLHSAVHLGIAVATEQGLIVPVIRDAQALDRAGLAKAAHDLAERARTKRLAPAEVQGGTFTITNPGVFGNLFGTPMLNPPQAAILGMGALQKRPAVRDGAVVARDMMYLSLTYDHRLIDGMRAGRFLQRVVALLE
jgi:pyruvate/2-oxoglutarate dehydrogenase complex dihydrolipoamide acyltransferase (E2) component